MFTVTEVISEKAGHFLEDLFLQPMKLLSVCH